MKINSKIPALISAIAAIGLFLIFGISDVNAEQSGDLPSEAAIEGLIERLENVEDRDRLIGDLKSLRQAISKSQGENGADAPDVLSGVLENIADYLATAGDSIAVITQQAGNPADIFKWATRQATNADQRDLWLSVLFHVVLVVGSGFVVA